MADNIIYGGFRSKRRKKEDRENKILRCEVSIKGVQLKQLKGSVTNMNNIYYQLSPTPLILV